MVKNSPDKRLAAMTEKHTVNGKKFTVRPTQPEGGEWLLLDENGEKVMQKFGKQDVLDFLYPVEKSARDVEIAKKDELFKNPPKPTLLPRPRTPKKVSTPEAES